MRAAVVLFVGLFSWQAFSEKGAETIPGPTPSRGSSKTLLNSVLCPPKVRADLRSIGGYNDCQIRQICGEVEIVSTSSFELEKREHAQPFTEYLKLKGCENVVVMQNGGISQGTTDRPDGIGYTMASKNCTLIDYNNRENGCNGKNKRIIELEAQPVLENSKMLLLGKLVCLDISASSVVRRKAAGDVQKGQGGD